MAVILNVFWQVGQVVGGADGGFQHFCTWDDIQGLDVTLADFLFGANFEAAAGGYDAVVGKGNPVVEPAVIAVAALQAGVIENDWNAISDRIDLPRADANQGFADPFEGFASIGIAEHFEGFWLHAPIIVEGAWICWFW